MGLRYLCYVIPGAMRTASGQYLLRHEVFQGGYGTVNISLVILDTEGETNGVFEGIGICADAPENMRALICPRATG